MHVQEACAETFRACFSEAAALRTTSDVDKCRFRKGETNTGGPSPRTPAVLLPLRWLFHTSRTFPVRFLFTLGNAAHFWNEFMIILVTEDSSDAYALQ